MTLQILAPPGVEPTSLDQAKAFLRVTHTDEDQLITDLIVSLFPALSNSVGATGTDLTMQNIYDGRWRGGFRHLVFSNCPRRRCSP